MVTRRRLFLNQHSFNLPRFRFLFLLLSLFALTVLVGCSSTASREGVNPAFSGTGVTNAPGNPRGVIDSMLGVGDFITVSFTDVPAIVAAQFRDQKVRIPDDGMITLPYNVRVQAAGRKIPELEAAIRTNYVPGYFQNFTAIVKPEERFYYVGGEVRNPGPRPYIGNMTVLRAIDTAQGFTDFARKTSIEVRREDGRTELVNWKKARKNPKLDLPVYPNDHIIVPKGI